MNILLIDDNPRYLTEVLPIYGHNVTCCSEYNHVLKNLLTDKKYDFMIVEPTRLDNKDIISEIRKSENYHDIPIIALSGSNELSKMLLALKRGADDYISKPFVLPNLLTRIEVVSRRCNHNNPTILPNKVTNPQTNLIKSLTKREKDVLLLVTQGYNNKEIAQKLTLSEITIKSHIGNLFKKLKVKNRTQAVLIAMQTDFQNNN